MNEKKEINYLLRCPECNLALFKSRRISKLPIKQGYHCYGCDKDVSFSHSDVELVIEPKREQACMVLFTGDCGNVRS